MSAITTHVLDTSRGRPAAGVPVLLETHDGSSEWNPVARGMTDADGRLRTLMPEGDSLRVGAYRLVFNTRQYFGALGVESFHHRIVIEFETVLGETHYHVPLLLSPFGYTTYRGT